jgi:hypothetical protein
VTDDAPPDTLAAGDPRAILLSPDAPVAGAWYRRRGPLLAACVAAVLAITVLTDLPTSSSPAANVAAANAFVREVNGDLAGCTLSVTQAIALRTAEIDGTLTAADRSNAPSLLRQNVDACTPDSTLIDDLGDVDEPGTPANAKLSTMFNVATTWATTDAYNVLVEITDLYGDPTDGADLHALGADITVLNSDRAEAQANLTAAASTLHTTLVPLALPLVTDPRGP